MILALVIFAVTYLLMLALPKERPWVALCSAAVFMALGQLGVYDFSLSAALGAVDYNVLLMMSGTMWIDVALHPEPDAGPPGRAADRPRAQCPVGCVRAGTLPGSSVHL